LIPGLITPTKSPTQKPPSPLPKKSLLRKEWALHDLSFLEEQTSFQGGPVGPGNGWQVMAWSFLATVIDLFVVIAMVCFFLMLSLLIQRFHLTKLNLNHNIFLPISLLTFTLLDSTYLIFLRIFLGNTLGEWACDLRLGEPRQRLSSNYSLRVLNRFFFVVVTGVVTLPVLSLLTGVDWAGKLSGLFLISLKKPRLR